MGSHDTSPQQKNTMEKTSIEHTSKPLFSQKEIKAIVKDFVAAYIAGYIKLHHVSTDELLSKAKKKREKLDYASAYDTELKLKIDFKKNIAIVAGAKEATPEELQIAINNIFDLILAYRNGKRIEGTFSEYALESRVKQLEDGLEKLNNLMEEVVDWIYQGRVEK